MKLARPFYQLPTLFDVGRLQAEVDALPDAAWVAHPDAVPGNSAVRLISAGGAETDALGGQMLATGWLDAMPYVQQVLASFNVVWGRSRLMRLAPGAVVPPHADIAYHWYDRVRVHIPVATSPGIHFHCDGETVHMAAGEAWIFDNWRRHSVENHSAQARTHIVADTTGTAGFWRTAVGPAIPRSQWRKLAWEPGRSATLLREHAARPSIMPAPELQLLVNDFVSELTTIGDTIDARRRIELLSSLLQDFVLDWRQLCVLHGSDSMICRPLARLAESVREAAAALGAGLVMRSNSADAALVLDKRILQHLFA